MQPRSLVQIVRRPFARNIVEVLENVSLSVQKGMATALLGPNGAGKTTLLRIIATTLRPDRGFVYIMGEDSVHKPHHLRRRLGVVLSDERSFFHRLTALQNLRFFAAMHDLDRRRTEHSIDFLAPLLGLRSELEKPFRNLSTGYRHRLALARALLHDPLIVLMDEPTRGLDPGAAKKIQEIIANQLVQKMRKTVFLATHDISLATAICDRIVVLKSKRIYASGRTSEVASTLGAVYASTEEELG